MFCVGKREILHKTMRSISWEPINPFTADPVKALHFAILVKPAIF